MAAPAEKLLDVRNLSVAFHQAGRTTVAVDRISFDVKKGETVALVGEFGLRQVGDRALGDEAPAVSVREPSDRQHQLRRP